MTVVHIDVNPKEPWVSLCGAKNLEPGPAYRPDVNVIELYIYLQTGLYKDKVLCKKCENHPHFDLHILALTELE